MADRLFGTDGIRGKVNVGAIRPANFVRFGEALGKTLRRDNAANVRVVIGCDTRTSGKMIESAIVSGLINAGAVADLIGVVPTPAVGLLTRTHGYSAGLMITASHNPASDNGVKVFGADGFKLSSELQAEIEALIQSEESCHVDIAEMGTVAAVNLSEVYAEFARTTVSKGITLAGLKVCVDAANGAGFNAAPEVLSALGADVVLVGAEPNGHNINLKCGALHPEKLTDLVLESEADIGLAFDGDADRIILVDEVGHIADGDQIMGAIGLDFHHQGKLKGGAIVATIMSNLGLEVKLRESGLRLERTAVGDRYVVQRMREGNFNVGGEQSGHVILSDYVTTGDALISALQILEIMSRDGRKASDVLSVFEPLPQILKNVRYKDSDPLENSEIKLLIESVQEKLGKDGRLVIRKSGTEPVIRVMAEATRPEAAEKAVDDLVNALSRFVG